MKISIFGTATTRRFAAIALLASFVFSNAFAVDRLAHDVTKPVAKSATMAKYTTDLTQLGREGRLREDLSFENEAVRLIKALGNGSVRQPVIVDEDKAVQEAIVEQVALRIAKGLVPADLAGKSIIKIETSNLFSNVKTRDEAARLIDAIVKDAVESKGQMILFVDELTSFVGDTAQSATFFNAIATGKLDVIGGSSAAAYDERITANAEIAAYFSGILVTGKSDAMAFAEDSQLVQPEFRGDNVSSDLRDMMAADPTGRKRLDVIIQAKDADNAALRSLLADGRARIMDRIGSTDTLVVNLPLSALNILSTSGLINYVSPDRQIASLGHVQTTTGQEQMKNQSSGFGRSSYNLDGTGVAIAVLDSGIYAAQKAFGDAGKIPYSQSFVTGVSSTDDDFGHGTHVASIAAGNPGRDGGSYRGVASRAKIINLKVLNGLGRGTTSAVLNALDWVLPNRTTYNIRVVNMSLGTPAVDTWTNDPLCRKVQLLNANGVLVVAAAGNNGKDLLGQKIYGHVHSPGNDPSVLTVGASNSLGTDSRADDIMSTYSSHGPTRSFYTDGLLVRHYDNVIKPDIVAPGNKIVDAKARDGSYLIAGHPELMVGPMNKAGDTDDVMYLSGTSMSAPMVSGAAALLFQMNPKLTPTMAKMLLEYSAQPLNGVNMLEQGAGQLNIDGAVRLGRTYRFDTDFDTFAQNTALRQAGIAFPVATSTIGGSTFPWAQGILTNYTYLKGQAIADNFQGVYRRNYWFESGVSYTGDDPFINSLYYTTGVTMYENVLTSNGTEKGDGPVMMPSGVLVADGLIV
jgi:subtilisin family serine protease